MIRIFIDEDLLVGKIILAKDEIYHYLVKVMRRNIGDEIKIFDNKTGEYRAVVNNIGKNNIALEIIAKEKDHYISPNISLIFSLVKSNLLENIAKKATELGVRSFYPVITSHSVVREINLDRFYKNICEASEQSERVDIPTLNPLSQSLAKTINLFLENINAKLIVADETGSGISAHEFIYKQQDLVNHDNSYGLITGPEGGFSKEEIELFSSNPNIIKISMGPRIMKVDTAIVSGLTILQLLCGDFNRNPK